jgi:hypothetical protein
MSESMKVQLKNLCKFEEAKRNYKLCSPPSIRFIPQVLGDDDPCETMTLDLRLSQPAETAKPQVTFSDGATSGSKEEEKVPTPDPPAKVVEKVASYKQKFRKMCHGTAEDYLKWHRSLMTIFKGKPCTTPEAKFEMTTLMLFGNLKDTWEAIMHEHIGVIVSRTFKKDTPEEHKKNVPRGFTNTGHKECLKQLAGNFFQEFAARKQKTYMRSNLIRPPQVPVKMMYARLKVMNAYLPSFPGPENSPFLTGEMIDIILSMIPKKWVETMVTAKIEPRNLTLKELVDHLENLELQGIDSEPEEIPKKKKREFKGGANGSKRDRNKDTKQAEKTCDLCRLFKGENSPAWKSHSTAQCKSKWKYENQLKTGNKRANKGSYSKERSNKRRKNMRASLKAEVKKSVKAAIKKRESGVSSSDDSE